MMNFTQSNALLERALKIIPNGTQTFSKSRAQYPPGVSPFYLVRGKGSHIWDVDGNEFIDFVSGLCPIILGYCDEDVDNAVMEQIKDGVIFSLPHPLEIEVAELLRDMIPSVEMVRFGKNGSDATSGAVRLARAYTGRDHIIMVNGHYHGWQDCFIGISGRNAGVPQTIRSLTHQFEYNDIKSLDRVFRDYPNQIACVIMEPIATTWPEEGFLEEVKELTHKNGALLIFDEIITGFRFGEGSAQKFFEVIPDLTCLGKAIANGYPLSAIVGKAEIMEYMEKIHFSFTNGGECLSLAAAKATLNKIAKEKVWEKLNWMGRKIIDYFIDKAFYSPIRIQGYPARTVLNFPNDTMKFTFMQECIARGILTIGCHNMTYAHSDEDINKLLSVYDEVLPNLDKIEFRGKIHDSKFKIRWY